MRLDFNVLWVDDQPGAVSSQIARIRTKMEVEGFNFNPTVCRSILDVQGLIAEDVFTDEIDLILVDWDLGGGVHGQDAISTIRASAPYKDVVFYSAQTPAVELRRFAFEEGLEGVYCANREELVDEFFGVFESLVKKVLDLDHTRGIVMGATSDIDELVNVCLLTIEAKIDDGEKKEFIAQAVERINARVKNVTKLAEKLRGAGDIGEILKAHMIFTANDRLRMLSRLLQKDAFKAHIEAKDRIRSYIDDVVPERNKLGHMVLAPQGKPAAVANAIGAQVSIDEMRELRRLILGLRQDFRELSDSLGS